MLAPPAVAAAPLLPEAPDPPDADPCGRGGRDVPVVNTVPVDRECVLGAGNRAGGVELDELDELAPAEPVVSAKATPGTDAIAAPTPRATASAPTRPT